MKNKTGGLPLSKTLIMGAVIGVTVILLSLFNILGGLEKSSYDLLFQLRRAQEPSPEVLIVGITEDCLEELGRWPWDREVHGKLLERLNEGEVNTVGMDIIFSEPSRESWRDQAMVEATRDSAPVIYPAVAPMVPSSFPGFLSSTHTVKPLPELQEVSEYGHITMAPDSDGIVRETTLWIEEEGEPLPSFALVLWARSRDMCLEELHTYLKSFFEQSSSPSSLTLGDKSFPLERGSQFLINFSGGPNNFPVLPYHLVLEGAYSPTTFDDAVVLVGYNAPGLGDYYFTPYEKEIMYGVEIHANILNSFLQEGPIHTLPLWANLLIIAAIAVGSLLLFRYIKPVWSWAAFLAAALAFFSAVWYLFSGPSLYVEAVYPLTALAGSYLTGIVYNFIAERQDRQRVTRIFSRYVAPQVVTEILDTGEENLKLGGVSREVTILFIDVRGFTPLSEKLTPEEVVAVLNKYFDLVTGCIFDNRGTVDKYMGDAVMALFNAPLPLEDHPLWAVKTGRDIVEKGAALQEEIREMAGVTLNFGIGINTGQVVVGNIGSFTRMEYTAIGDAVNLAARLESQAQPGQVLVSEYVYEKISGKIPLEPVGEMQVKGKSQPVNVYQLAKEKTHL